MNPLLSFPMLRAVLFDLWGTLIDDPAYRSAPRQEWRATNVRLALANHGVHRRYEDVDVALRAASAELTKLHDDGRDVSSSGRVSLFLKHLDPRLNGLSDDAARDIERAITDMRDDFAPHLAHEAIETVSGVRALGLGTALVSNAGLTSAPTLRRMLDSFGLTPHLDVFVFSDEIELAKPHPAVFQKALEGLGVSASEAAFVGDAPHNDIGGAQAAGLLAIQIGDHGHDSIRPDERISSLSELVPLLRARLAPSSR